MSKLVITNHARERWVERVINPKHYAHFADCKNVNHCQVCIKLREDMDFVLSNFYDEINKNISSLYYKSKNKKITDRSFLEIIQKDYDDFDKLVFLDCESCIFVISNHNEKSVLRTILKRGMLEGTIFKNIKNYEVDDLFKRWKFEDRQRK